MKVAKVLGAAGLLLAAGTLLTACGQSSDSTSTYSYVYGSDPDTLDYLFANRATTGDIIGNVVDGLFENDQYGNLVPSLAEDWSVSKDGLTYTYKLRKDAKWYTSEGEEYADVKAQDFVAGLKHVADKKSDALYLVEDSVKGLKDYLEGKTQDFSQVGVKAIDDYTLEYTLNQPETYWNSKTTATTLFPVNEEFLKSKGDDFGKVDPSSILYNGPFIIKSMTAKSSIEYAKNPNYYDKDNVHIDQIKLTYYDGSDQESLIRNFKDGAYSASRLYPNSSSFPAVEKEFKDNIYYTSQDATTYYLNFNVNRSAYKHTSKTDDAAKNATKEALLNRNFRLAVNFAFNRHAYAAQSNGETGADKVLRNTLVPPTFVQIGDKSYGDVLAEKLVNYGSQWENIDLSDAQDAYYNADKAKSLFKVAKSELEAKGVTFPIHIDTPVDQTDKIAVQQMSSLKQSLESTLGTENVVLDLQLISTEEYDNSVYFADAANQKDYDLARSGWGPDYQDPSTYLDILGLPSGAMLKNIGIEPGQDTEVAKQLGLNQYSQLLKEANSEKADSQKRYEKYAEAESWLLDSGLVMPYLSLGGNPFVSRIVPFTRPYSAIGNKGDMTYKYLKLQKDIVTAKDYEEAKAKWEKEKQETAQKAQEELKNHIK